MPTVFLIETAIIFFHDFCRTNLFIAATGYHLFTDQRHNHKNLKQTRGFEMQTLPILSTPLPHSKNDALLKQAQALEASFLSEMLSHTGLDTASEGFGGGTGEDQFGSFLREAQSKLMVAHGGIGLSEQLFHALSERSND